MTEHQLIGIRPRPKIQKTTAWHEVGCSCGWSATYPSAYSARSIYERHVERECELERTAT